MQRKEQCLSYKINPNNGMQKYPTKVKFKSNKMYADVQRQWKQDHTHTHSKISSFQVDVSSVLFSPLTNVIILHPGMTDPCSPTQEEKPSPDAVIPVAFSGCRAISTGLEGV